MGEVYREIIQSDQGRESEERWTYRKKKTMQDIEQIRGKCLLD